MTILSSKIILQRILEGAPNDVLTRIKEKLSLSNLKITNEKLAEEILKDNDRRRKFSEIFEIKPEEIKKIASEYRNLEKYPMEIIKEKSLKNELPILFDSVDIEKIRPANYDLRLGNQYFVSREKYPKRLEETGGYIVIEPGDFAILSTHEYIYVPDDLLGLISLKYKYKKFGLINISGFHVDPGYVGRLFFSVYNAGPKSVVLKHKEPIFMIMYDKLEEPVLRGYGEGYENIAVDEIYGLTLYSIPPFRLKSLIDSLVMELRILQGLVIALLVAIIAKWVG